MDRELSARLDAIEVRLDHLRTLLRFVAYAARERDKDIMARLDAEFQELDAELAGLTDAQVAMTKLVDRFLADAEANADDPEQLRAFIARAKASKEALIADALRGTPADPAAA